MTGEDDGKRLDRIPVPEEAVAQHAARQNTRWQGRSTVRVRARFAVSDAITGEDLREGCRDCCPDLPEAMAEPWRTATEVRAALRDLGPEVEAVALRMAPSWRLPLPLLPAAVRSLLSVDD